MFRTACRCRRRDLGIERVQVAAELGPVVELLGGRRVLLIRCRLDGIIVFGWRVVRRCRKARIKDVRLNLDHRIDVGCDLSLEIFRLEECLAAAGKKESALPSKTPVVTYAL